MTNRRTFLQTSSWATLATLGRLVPRASTAIRRATSDDGCPGHVASLMHGSASDLHTPDFHALAMRALDAATAAGAVYADVRFTITERRVFHAAHPLHPIDSTMLAVGVRALAHGAWGFAASTRCTPDTVTSLGRLAADEAKATVWPQVPPIIRGEQLPAMTGHWQTPIQRDPFTVPIEEFAALTQAMIDKAPTLQGLQAIELSLIFDRQARTFASTDGVFVTQTIATAFGGQPHDGAHSSLLIGAHGKAGNTHIYSVPTITPTGAGYEAVEALHILERLPTWVETAQILADAKPFEAMGEYDVVFDAYAMAQIVNATFGVALEYDRAIGDDANGVGTSYLAPPPTILGTRWAPPTVTITADRTLPGGAATVGWDDDGVPPHAVPLVQDGIVVNYATTREYAAELVTWYHPPSGRVQSNGCAASESALTAPMVHTPNLVVQPGHARTTFEDLLSGITHGYAICGGDVTMDMQQVTGQGQGADVYEIRNGKLGAPVAGAMYVFKSRDLWRNLVALGGPGTAASCGLFSGKGEPNQVAMHTVHAVAARFQKVRVERDQ